MKIIKPTLLLDKQKCISNIEFMVEKAKKHKLSLKPHFKTHQSVEIGSWFKDFGIKSITVSSVDMALYFADNGWDEITLAFPINILQIKQIQYLSRKVKLNLVAVSYESVKQLCYMMQHDIGVFIKIDSGAHRTGLLPSQTNEIDRLITEIKKTESIRFKGFMVHSGHTYHAQDVSEIINIHHHSQQIMHKLKERYVTDFPDLTISIGDTPSCSLMDDFEGIDEIRPGNFVFYDLMQMKIGSCKYEHIAIALACPVVAKHASRKEIVLYGGAIHLSKEYLLRQNKAKNYGEVVLLNENGWKKPLRSTYIKDVSQEHGILKTTSREFGKIKIGDVVGILPVHSCLTANLMKTYLTLDDQRIEMMP